MSDDSPSTWIAAIAATAAVVGGAIGWMFKPGERNQTSIDEIWRILREDHVHRTEFAERGIQIDKLIAENAALVATQREVLRRLDRLESERND